MGFEVSLLRVFVDIDRIPHEVVMVGAHPLIL